MTPTNHLPGYLANHPDIDINQRAIDTLLDWVEENKRPFIYQKRKFFKEYIWSDAIRVPSPREK